MSLEFVGFDVQSERGAPYVSVPHVQPIMRSAGVGQVLRVHLQNDPKTPIAAYRFNFKLKSTDPESIRLHYAGFPRMIGAGSIALGQDVGEGDRSPLTASYHFDERMGSQSFALFPPLVILQGEHPVALIAAATEHRDRHSFTWRATPEGILVELQFDIWGIQKPAQLYEEFFSEDIYIQEWSEKMTFGPETFSDYHRLLHRFQKTPSQELFWGSWNDGHFRNIDESRILANADWLKSNLENVKWIQIDDGWAKASNSVAGSLEDGCATLDMSDFGVFYRPEDLDDDPRFPNGLGGLAQSIKDRSLKPMIWLTPSVLETSPLYRDHPDWFQEKTRLHFYREMRFLDLSVPEAQAYVRSVFDLVFKNWGFQGCKLDYWSMGFDQHDVTVRQGHESAMEHMRWLATTLREYVGPDGLLLYGIDLPFGSPLRAGPFNQFRYYADSEGSCQSITAMKEQALWAAFLVGLYQVQRYWVPDGDGLGLFRHFTMPENHYRLWGSFLLGSGTLTELAGWLHLAPASPRLDLLRAFTAHARLGNRVSLPGYDFLKARQDPPTVWVRHDQESERLVSLTNWTAEPIEVALTPEMLKFMPGVHARDLVTGETFELPANFTINSEDGRVLLILAIT